MKWLDLINKSKKMRFYSSQIAANILPSAFYEKQLAKILSRINDYDRDYILGRVDYCNQLARLFRVDQGIQIDDFNHKGNSAYVLDFKKAIRYFPKSLKLNYEFGDVVHVPEVPCFVKSRPINKENENAILLKLDSVRHFNFVKDNVAFSDKKDMAVWRGAVFERPQRVRLLENYYHHPKCDFGDTDKRKKGTQYYKEYMSLSQQLEYKFIVSIQGTDVATNTKWIMSSNSLCFMPKPKFETWFMEGRLVPDHHYVELKDDYSDLEEKMAYYSKNTDKALAIIKNAHDYVAQFKNNEQEQLISLLVMKKYFELSEQM
ncbi:glycosyl transferase family 90 [Facilibium subflavum]|uniref:glycosyl transferase family 90 n=1 Tax=Facilibium subflavum TaxID=2219058 RepID=UPI000E656646|nr:glycosyl transferase family 90 [Facilibium subflavum]